jgi:hypothetical protein
MSEDQFHAEVGEGVRSEQQLRAHLGRLFFLDVINPYRSPDDIDPGLMVAPIDGEA